MMEPYPTDHLLKNMKLRNVSWGEILEVLENPEVTFGPDERGRYTHQRGNLCVVMSREGAVITVLLRSQEQWKNEDVASRELKTRQCLKRGIHPVHTYKENETTYYCEGVYFN